MSILTLLYFCYRYFYWTGDLSYWESVASQIAENSHSTNEHKGEASWELLKVVEEEIADAIGNDEVIISLDYIISSIRFFNRYFSQQN